MATLSKEPPQQGPTPAVVAATAEDDSSKRNTDCVYFLASPLTCKKGSECEFRHSESARTNPRDCWYWMNGNCLNPKCAFRHPPLDGMVPPQVGNIAGPSFPVPPSGPPVPLVPHNGGKQTVPCIYFHSGFCAKGDRCPFMHGPVPPSNTKIQPNPATAGATEAPTYKKTFGVLEKSTQPKMSFHANASKVIEAPRQPLANAGPKVVSSRLMERGPALKRYPPSGVIEETPRYKEAAPSSVDNGSLRSRASRQHHSSLVDDQNHQNGKDVEDSFRESSPGFDVLVDDKLREDEYYHDEDQYGRVRGREGRRMDEFDMGHHDDYNPVADVDLDNYRSKRGHDAYDGLRETYARGLRGASSERMSAHDKRGSYKSETPDMIQNSSDLRHRLSKQRGSNGLRSVVSPDYKPDYHREDRGYRSSRRSPVRERTVSSRLQGRLKLPRSPPTSGNMYSERDNERGRNLGRSSPSRPQVPSHQGRLRDRLSGRIQDESDEGRNLRGQMRKESTLQANGSEFTAPKSLVELRGSKRSDNNHRQPIDQQSISGGNLRDTVLGSSVGTEGDVAFDGPKPLSEILKRKRNVGTTTSTGAVNGREAREQNKNGDFVSDTGKQVALSPTPKQTQGVVPENSYSATAEGDKEEGEISNKKIKLVEDESSFPDDEKHPEAEEGIFGGNGEEHEADEEYDQGDEEYDYEQEDDAEGYNLNEGEVDEGDPADNDDFMDDDDDGDDFAKKLGVSF